MNGAGEIPTVVMSDKSLTLKAPPTTAPELLTPVGKADVGLVTFRSVMVPLEYRNTCVPGVLTSKSWPDLLVQYPATLPDWLSAVPLQAGRFGNVPRS